MVSGIEGFRHLFDVSRYCMWPGLPVDPEPALAETDLPAELPQPSPSERAHIVQVLRLCIAGQRIGLADGLKAAPEPVRALAGGRVVSTRGLWLVGLWCGLLPCDLMRAARRAQEAAGRAAA